jgi:hypothetical protein
MSNTVRNGMITNGQSERYSLSNAIAIFGGLFEDSILTFRLIKADHSPPSSAEVKE